MLLTSQIHTRGIIIHTNIIVESGMSIITKLIDFIHWLKMWYFWIVMKLVFLEITVSGHEPSTVCLPLPVIQKGMRDEISVRQTEKHRSESSNSPKRSWRRKKV